MDEYLNWIGSKWVCVKRRDWDCRSVWSCIYVYVSIVVNWKRWSWGMIWIDLGGFNS